MKDARGRINLERESNMITQIERIQIDYPFSIRFIPVIRVPYFNRFYHKCKENHEADPVAMRRLYYLGQPQNN